MSVESWIIQQLNPEDDDDLEPVIKVTVRLMHDEVAELDDIARRLGLSRTACAAGLLRSAVTEALSFFNDGQADERIKNYLDFRTIEQMEKEQEQARDERIKREAASEASRQAIKVLGKALG